MAQDLREHGIDAWIDRFEPAPPEGWPRWIENQIDQADFIVLICTPQFRKIYQGETKSSEHRGAAWGGFLANSLHSAGDIDLERLVPVYFDGDSPGQAIPTSLRDATCHELPMELDALVGRLTRTLAVKPRPVAEVFSTAMPDHSLSAPIAPERPGAGRNAWIAVAGIVLIGLVGAVALHFGGIAGDPVEAHLGGIAASSFVAVEELLDRAGVYVDAALREPAPPTPSILTLEFVNERVLSESTIMAEHMVISEANITLDPDVFLATQVHEITIRADTLELRGASTLDLRRTWCRPRKPRKADARSGIAKWDTPAECGAPGKRGDPGCSAVDIRLDIGAVVGSGTLWIRTDGMPGAPGGDGGDGQKGSICKLSGGERPPGLGGAPGCGGRGGAGGEQSRVELGARTGAWVTDEGPQTCSSIAGSVRPEFVGAQKIIVRGCVPEQAPAGQNGGFGDNGTCPGDKNAKPTLLPECGKSKCNKGG